MSAAELSPSADRLEAPEQHNAYDHQARTSQQASHSAHPTNTPCVSGLELHIFDIDEDFCAIASKVFAGTSVKIHHAPLATAGTSAVVHPGNAHGIVAGGMDAAFLDHFGPGYQMLLRTTLESRFGGTQPQDEAVLLETGHPVQRMAIHVCCYPHEPDTAFRALSVALHAIVNHNDERDECDEQPHVESLACSGLGTYTGCSHRFEAAVQMFAAYETIA